MKSKFLLMIIMFQLVHDTNPVTVVGGNVQTNFISSILSMDHTVTEVLTLEIISMNMRVMTVTTACMLSFLEVFPLWSMLLSNTDSSALFV